MNKKNKGDLSCIINSICAISIIVLTIIGISYDKSDTRKEKNLENNSVIEEYNLKVQPQAEIQYVEITECAENPTCRVNIKYIFKNTGTVPVNKILLSCKFVDRDDNIIDVQFIDKNILIEVGEEKELTGSLLLPGNYTNIKTDIVRID